MTEEKRQGKKTGIIKRIFRWIGLGLLAALIIGAITFEAPWKVIALLLIFLAACTILPKPARKWFWLSVATVIIALIIWILLPDNNKDWKPYKFPFVNEIAAIDAQYKIPDKENAAVIYNELLENYSKDKSEPNFQDYRDANCVDKTLNPWKTQDYPEIAEWLKQKQPVLEKLAEASNIEKCSFPVSSPVDISTQVDRLSAMRHWAQMLIRAANNDSGEGRNTEAFEKCLTVMKIGQQLCRQPTQIDWLVGTAIESLGISRIKQFIVDKDINKEQLDSVEENLRQIEYDWNKYFRRMLEYEKLSIKDLFSNCYEINSKGKTRISRDPLSSFRTHIRSLIEEKKEDDEIYKRLIEDKELYKRFLSVAYPSYFQRKTLKAMTILLWFYMPSTPQKLSEIIDKHFERFYSLEEAYFIKLKEPEEFSYNQIFSTRAMLNFDYATKLMSNMTIDTFYSFHKIYKRTFAENRGFQILIALRRYRNQNGQWPDSLEEIKPLIQQQEILIDPMNNGSFVYKLTEDGFTLYGKGLNNIDEDGKRDGCDGKTGADDWPIWPTTIKQKPESKTQDAE
jgi:hypothetical protein